MENSMIQYDAAIAKPDQDGAKLQAYRRMFEDWRSLTQDQRRQSDIHRDYFDGNQLTAQEQQVLRARKQPVIVINRVKPAINGTLGIIDRGRIDPKALPKTPDDQKSSEIATDVLRFVSDENRLNETRSDLAENMFVEGYGGVIVEEDNQDIKVTQVRFEELIYDPRSRRKDFKDARYLGIAKWRYVDEVAQEYGIDEADALLNAGGLGVTDDTLKDRPDKLGDWVDIRKRRVMVVDMYHLEGGVWQRCLFCGAGVLFAGESRYLDTKRKPACPIEAHTAFIDRDNNRYGLVKDMVGPQDEINKRRSKLLHLTSTSRIVQTDIDAIVDADTARREAAMPDGVIPYGYQEAVTAAMQQGQAELLREAKSEIERMGPNPSILARGNEGASGRSQLIQQQAGMVELSRLFSGIDDLMLRIYRQVWDRCKQFWQEPKWVRVTGDADAAKFVGINQPIMGEQPAIVMGLDGMPMIGTEQVQTGVENNVAEMNVDIIVDSTQDTAVVAQEQWQALIELVKFGVQIPPDVLIEASSLPKKQQILDKLREPPQQSSQPDPEKAADVEKKMAEAERAKAQAAQVNQEIQGNATMMARPALPPPGMMGASPMPTV